ncbi:MAG: hypothetical protein OEW75_04645 [Cyclobacteriaceae bacterium]|nr:hypothetical protein [Cyclobacteriaceae bacterium]
MRKIIIVNNIFRDLNNADYFYLSCFIPEFEVKKSDIILFDELSSMHVLNIELHQTNDRDYILHVKFNRTFNSKYYTNLNVKRSVIIKREN